jgi:hypothetical protein
VGNIIIYIITKYCITINLTINIINTAFTPMDLLQPGNIVERNTSNKGTDLARMGTMHTLCPSRSLARYYISEACSYCNNEKIPWSSLKGLPSLTAACCRDKRMNVASHLQGQSTTEQ